MHPVLRMIGIIVVFVVSTVAWLTLGGITQGRTNKQTYEMPTLVFR